MSQSVDIRSGTEFVQHVHREYGTCAVLELRVLISDVVGRRLYAGPPGDLSPVAVEAVSVSFTMLLAQVYLLLRVIPVFSAVDYN